MASPDPLREAVQIREQLASAERRLAFFFGAGTSMAVGVPGIVQLTEQIAGQLPEPQKEQFSKLMADLPMAQPNVEDVLDHIRICRELFGESDKKQYGCLQGATLTKELDRKVCQSIRNIVNDKSPAISKPHTIFAQWLQQLRIKRDRPVEVFTTNYDLLLEKSLESSSVPFFDGFVGSVAPFFAPESVEAELTKSSEGVYPPRSWTRLWKLHGSINWYLSTANTTEVNRISRISGPQSIEGSELVIFPSREKYSQSRKLPFLTFQDRLRRFVSQGSCLLVVLGYSFSDDHLNEIVFQGLRSNPDLAVAAFIFTSLPEGLIQQGQENRNLTLYGPDKACIGGIVAPWSLPNRTKKENEHWPFWDGESKQFTLGDFNNFASFLELFVGFRPTSLLQTETVPEKPDTLPIQEVSIK